MVSFTPQLPSFRIPTADELGAAPVLQDQLHPELNIDIAACTIDQFRDMLSANPGTLVINISENTTMPKGWCKCLNQVSGLQVLSAPLYEINDEELKEVFAACQSLRKVLVNVQTITPKGLLKANFPATIEYFPVPFLPIVLGDAAEKRDILQKAEAKEKKDAVSHVVSALCHLLDKTPEGIEEHIKFLKESVAIAPRFVFALSRLGEALYYKKGVKGPEAEEAIKFLETALSIMPNNTSARLALFRLYIQENTVGDNLGCARKHLIFLTEAKSIQAKDMLFDLWENETFDIGQDLALAKNLVSQMDCLHKQYNTLSQKIKQAEQALLLANRV